MSCVPHRQCSGLVHDIYFFMSNFHNTHYHVSGVHVTQFFGLVFTIHNIYARVALEKILLNMSKCQSAQLVSQPAARIVASILSIC